MNKFSLWLMLALFCGSSPVWSEENSSAFTATPERCVALHKGQICYQDVVFRWQTPEVGNYCLVLSRNQKKIVCWNGKSMQQYQYSFKGDITTNFSLVSHEEKRQLAQAKVVVTWVYKAPKQSQSGWRLF